MVRFIFITLIKIFSVNSTTYYRIPVTSATTIYAIITFFKFRTDIRRLCMSVVNTDVFRNKKKHQSGQRLNYFFESSLIESYRETIMNTVRGSFIKHPMDIRLIS